MTQPRFLAAAAALLLLAGCAGFGSKTEEYKDAQSRASRPLEVPPELTSPTMDDRYSIPDPHAVTSYSTYSQKGPAAAGAAPAAGAPVLPKFENVSLTRAGDQRWLVVKGEPEKVWPVVREFWIDSGYDLLKEEPQLGIMETDWKEDRAKIPQDIIRRTIGKVLDGLYSYPRRDKFRTRLERGTEPGTTEVYVSNRNMEEVYSSSTQDRTFWQPRPADESLEGEMLSRLMVKLGGGDTKVTTASAPLPGRRGAVPAGATAPVSHNAALENSGAGPLVVNDSFDRAWRRVGLALDRVGFTVEDRDRSKGLFYVRYVDPDVDLSTTQQQSWVQKLMFWKSPPKTVQPQYRIHVADAGANSSQVQVQDKNGGAESSSTGKKILGLLYEQLK